MSGSDPASELCSQCGLCCDGSLFLVARAYPDDLAGLAAHHVPLDPDPKPLAFRQPCPCLSGTFCTIYPDRFTTCRSFRCVLLRKLDIGAVSVAEGLQVVATARNLLAEIEPDGRRDGTRQDLLVQTARWRDLSDTTERTALAKRHVAVVTLDRYLARYFRGAKRQSPPPENNESTERPDASNASTRLRPS